jgi:hypothetical protein
MPLPPAPFRRHNRGPCPRGRKKGARRLRPCRVKSRARRRRRQSAACAPLHLVLRHPVAHLQRDQADQPDRRRVQDVPTVGGGDHAGGRRRPLAMGAPELASRWARKATLDGAGRAGCRCGGRPVPGDARAQRALRRSHRPLGAQHQRVAGKLQGRGRKH